MVGIPRPTGNFPESLSRQILAGIFLSRKITSGAATDPVYRGRSPSTPEGRSRVLSLRKGGPQRGGAGPAGDQKARGTPIVYMSSLLGWLRLGWLKIH